MKLFLSIVLVSAMFPLTQVYAQETEVTITGIRNTKGQIVLGVFRDDEGFRKEVSVIEKRYPKKDLSGGEMKVQLALEPGIYGIAVLDDEDGNGKMYYNFLGIPREGFGFSDYYHTGLTRPKFDDFKFSTGNDQAKKVTVKIRYIL